MDPAALSRRAVALGQRILTPADAAWPHEAFGGLGDPPLALFIRGTLPPPEAFTAAIVGSRGAGAYGLRHARRLAEGLARRGFWVLSGLALGIDGAAHFGALAGGGSSLAVLGCGLDVPYPIEHLDLKDLLVASGGVLSEYPPGTRPHPAFFPRRNRIVAALARVVVVVEAPWDSGALITARLANEQGREVLVLPGPVGTPGFRGSHQLLRAGEAGLCEDVRDVLRALEFSGVDPQEVDPPPRPAPPAGAPRTVFQALEEAETVTIEVLVRRTGLGPREVATAITHLELGGYIARVAGVGVQRA